MRVTHITWTFTLGGIETMLVNIANEQTALGHEVHIVVIEHNNVEPTLAEKLNPNIKLHLVNRKYGVKDIIAIIRLNRLIHTISPNAIHLHSASIYKYLLPYYRKICNSTLHDICGSSNTSCIQKIPRVFAISEAVYRDLKQKKGVLAILNPNGIRPELFKTKERTTHTLFRIVQVSRLMYKKKGQDILIKAAAELKQRGFNNFIVSFIGDGDSLDFLKHLSNKLNINDKIEFLGAKSQNYLYENLCSFDLFVQPSRYEGFGLTVAEAMAAKVPVIVSSGQGPEEVIDYGRCGYIFKNGDYKELATRIEAFLKGENNQSFIKKGHQRVWNLYNIKVTTKTYLDNYICR